MSSLMSNEISYLKFNISALINILTPLMHWHIDP